jgi:short-subunit dehydrogenase
VSGTRTIVVTGASSGIGRALARLAARSGWDVLATGRRAGRLAELERDCADASGTLSVLALDLTTPGAAETIVRAALDRTGRIDVIAAVAGSGSAGDAISQTDRELREQFEVHAVAPVALAREARAALAQTKGLVMFVGSGVARVPMGGFGAYSGAKAAIRSLSRTVRLELRGDGIAVTYVDPGVIATEFHSRLGYEGPPKGVAVTPELVAERMFAAIPRRPRELNAVPLHTFSAALGQIAPRLTDELMLLAPGLFGLSRPPEAPPPEPPPPEPATVPAPPPTAAAEADRPNDPVAAVLEPLAARMKRQKLPQEFVASLLAPGSAFDLGEAAMRWAGMPNKNERAVMRDVLEALADAGFLERTGDFAYRAPEGATSTDTYVS